MKNVIFSDKKKNILFMGNVPPPVTGGNVISKHLLNSKFSRIFHVTFINCRFIFEVGDMGKFTLYKVCLGMKYLARLCICLTTRSYDVVMINYASFGWAVIRDSLSVLMASTLFKRKVLLWMHGNGIIDFDQRCELSQKMISLALESANKVVLPGNNLRTGFARWVTERNMAAVPHGIAPIFGEHEVIRNPSLGRTVNVLFFSNMIREKGWLITLKAAAKLKNRDDIHFVFCGAWLPVSDEAYAGELVKQWGLKDKVDFRGKTIGEEKKAAFAEADIFVFPTFFPIETFGIVNLEAMDAGLPIITTSRGAIPELIEDGVNGYLVPEQNIEALTEKIIYLSDHQEIRYEMGKRNKEKFMKYFSLDAFADRWIRVINDVLEDAKEQ